MSYCVVSCHRQNFTVDPFWTQWSHEKPTHVVKVPFTQTDKSLRENYHIVHQALQNHMASVPAIQTQVLDSSVMNLSSALPQMTIVCMHGGNEALWLLLTATYAWNDEICSQRCGSRALQAAGYIPHEEQYGTLEIVFELCSMPSTDQ